MVRAHGRRAGVSKVDDFEAESATVTGTVDAGTLDTGSTNIGYINLSDTSGSFPIPNSDILNSTVTINGSSVSLGGSATIPTYSDSDATDAINNDGDHGSTASHNYFSGSHNDLSNVGDNDHHNQNHDNSDHTTNYLPDSDYTPEADTHSRYSDSEARTAVDGANVDIAGDADTVDGKDANQIGLGSHDNSDHTTNYLPDSDYTPEADTHSQPTSTQSTTISTTRVTNGIDHNLSSSFGGPYFFNRQLVALDEIKINPDNLADDDITLELHDGTTEDISINGNGWYTVNSNSAVVKIQSTGQTNTIQGFRYQIPSHSHNI